MLPKTEADPDAEQDPDGTRDCGADEGPVLVGDAEAMEVGAGLAELVGEHAGLGARLLEGLLGRGGGHHFGLRGQNAAASARPSAPVVASFSSRLTGVILTAWVLVPELTVPRQRAPG